jgi:hypothetical protein
MFEKFEYFLLKTLLIIFFINNNILAQNRFEVSLFAGYSQPKLEAYGSNNIIIKSYAGPVLIGGKNLVNSDNFATTFGYNMQVTGKYNFFKSGILKAILNLGYNQLQSKYGPLSDGWNYGTRLNMFFLSGGLETVPVKIKNLYPSLYGLLNIGIIGGETYHFAGIDFLIAEPRIGYNFGLNINYKISKLIGVFMGVSYSYANWLLKKTNEGIANDPFGHDIFFRDKASPTNGLSHDRRIVYNSYLGGVNFYLK